jgi:hypothetical protein
MARRCSEVPLLLFQMRRRGNCHTWLCKIVRPKISDFWGARVTSEICKHNPPPTFQIEENGKVEKGVSWDPPLVSFSRTSVLPFCDPDQGTGGKEDAQVFL